MLKMTLTDGVNEVFAMEKMSIPCLNDRLPPGTKVSAFSQRNFAH